MGHSFCPVVYNLQAFKIIWHNRLQVWIRLVLMVFLFGKFSKNVEQIINIYRIFYKLSQEINSISQKSSFLFKKSKVEIKNFIKVIRDVVLIILNHFQPSFLQNYYIFPFHVEPNLCAPNMPCTNQEVEQWGFQYWDWPILFHLLLDARAPNMHILQSCSTSHWCMWNGHMW